MFLKLSLLTPQEGLTLFDDALKLPRGFLLAFEDKDKTNDGVFGKMCKAFSETVKCFNPLWR